MDESWFETGSGPPLPTACRSSKPSSRSATGLATMTTTGSTTTASSAVIPTLRISISPMASQATAYQQGPATGNAIAELICHGGYRTMDLTRLGYERLQRNEPLFERKHFLMAKVLAISSQVVWGPVGNTAAVRPCRQPS